MRLSINIRYWFSQTFKQSFASSKSDIENASDRSDLWYPSKEQDLNLIGHQLLNVKDDFGNNHMQFVDLQYRKRRNLIANRAKQIKIGQKIPDVCYNEEQKVMWKNVYQNLRNLHQKCISQRFEKQIKKLSYSLKLKQKVPQLQQVSEYLQSETGFRLKPTHGILTERQFFNAFAFKVFFCTQYLRNPKTPQYTPEPDLIHEIVGHAPMFADPAIAELSHEIGLLSLGATDEQVTQLGRIYHYTLEFGVCRENNKMKGYGAGIASSSQEIANFLSDRPSFRKFNPFLDCLDPYPIQKVQYLYRVADSLQEALLNLKQFSRQMQKPFIARYNQQKKMIESEYI